ncbi:MAG: hypothetical protein ACFCGT_01300 [Sandaracinaceae bacterium]
MTPTPRFVPLALALAALAVPGLLARAPRAGAQADAGPPFVGAPVDQDRLLTSIANGVPRQISQVGTSSVTLRLELGARDAAFKPRSRTHTRGYLAEIAAYRVARWLAFDNVPPATILRIPRPFLRSRYREGGADAWERLRTGILWDAPGVVRGAVIYWVPDLTPTDLDEAEGIERFSGWLRGDGEIPADRAPVARDVSNMLAFDYLIGNWDRFSGGNVSTNAEGTRLYVRDHNLAFQTPLTDGRYDRLRGHLERVQRFSRTFVSHLVSLDEASLREALAQEPESQIRDVLSDAQVQEVLVRRRALLSYISALAAVHGVERVLYFE